MTHSGPSTVPGTIGRPPGMGGPAGGPGQLWCRELHFPVQQQKYRLNGGVGAAAAAAAAARRAERDEAVTEATAAPAAAALAESTKAAC